MSQQLVGELSDYPHNPDNDLPSVQIRIYSTNMHHYIQRDATGRIIHRLREMPAVALLGARQCGKSTLADFLLETIPQSIYLDLERPRDRNKLQDAEAFLSLNKDKLICLDEIQLAPDLFALLRGVIDERRRNGQFLILGSASRDLIRQTSESLAGRISYFELTPFILPEVVQEDGSALRRLWLRGGFPRSYLAGTDEASFQWRLDFIRSFLERDIPQLNMRILPQRVERLWQMCAHTHGQLLNYSKLAGSLGLTDHTVRSYIELLNGAFMVRVLPPMHANLKKRLVKSPKVYIRDSGILHTMLGLEIANDLFGHPVYGASWEGFVIENILANLKPQVNTSFYRTAKGAEIDLVLEKGDSRLAVECKASSAPRVARSFHTAVQDIDATLAFVVAPVEDRYPIADNIEVTSLEKCLIECQRRGFLV